MSVWESVTGQELVIEQLRTAAADERPTHAWLFSSPPGAGREVAALAFAAALLCDQPAPTQRGCGTCKSCTTVLAGTHADFTRFRTQNTTIKIEEARELVTKAQDRPSVGRWRIMMVDDADRMPERTSNVLLKAIEEPPPHTIWILCTPSAHDVLVTIRSRCRPVKLRLPRVETVASLLVSRGLDKRFATYLATLSQGNIETALQLASSEQALKRREQVARMPLHLPTISAAMHAAKDLVDIAEAASEADATARNEADRVRLLQALGVEPDEKMTPSTRSQLRRLEEDQKRRAKRLQTDTLDRFLVDIQTVLRDVLSLQLATGSPLINISMHDEISAYAGSTTPAITLQTLDTVALTRRRIRSNASARLAFEAMMVSFVRTA